MSKSKRRVKSKAAEATAAQRAARCAHDAHTRRAGRVVEEPSDGLPEAVEFKGGGGLLTGMRSGFQSVAGAGTKKRRSWMNTALWLLVAAMAIFMFGGGHF